MLFILPLVEAVYVYESFQHFIDCMMEEVPQFNVLINSFKCYQAFANNADAVSECRKNVQFVHQSLHKVNLVKTHNM